MEEERIDKLKSLFSVGRIIGVVGFVTFAILAFWANVTWVNSQEVARLSEAKNGTEKNIMMINMGITSLNDNYYNLNNIVIEFIGAQKEINKNLEKNLEKLTENQEESNGKFDEINTQLGKISGNIEAWNTFLAKNPVE